MDDAHHPHRPGVLVAHVGLALDARARLLRGDPGGHVRGVLVLLLLRHARVLRRRRRSPRRRAGRPPRPADGVRISPVRGVPRRLRAVHAALRRARALRRLRAVSHGARLARVPQVRRRAGDGRQAAQRARHARPRETRPRQLGQLLAHAEHRVLVARGQLADAALPRRLAARPRARRRAALRAPGRHDRRAHRPGHRVLGAPHQLGQLVGHRQLRDAPRLRADHPRDDGLRDHLLPAPAAREVRHARLDQLDHRPRRLGRRRAADAGEADLDAHRALRVAHPRPENRLLRPARPRAAVF
mmetsp:Transcript_8216/g.33815  ORF Transcript_8216/g.33815 Transcript_8216/m.33815 type:complete len:300 (+) Transcript_8216:424-1323(+)